jgi:hypothetical protein
MKKRLVNMSDTIELTETKGKTDDHQDELDSEETIEETIEFTEIDQEGQNGSDKELDSVYDGLLDELEIYRKNHSHSL